MTPDWVAHFTHCFAALDAERLRRFRPPSESEGRQSAVLMLFAESESGIDLVLIERAVGTGAHSAQIAFPGGGMDADDEHPTATALREAREEIALNPDTVQVFAQLPSLWLPASANVVTPVAAWWRQPHAVHAADPREVADVRRVPLKKLADPSNRLRTRTPSGLLLPAFEVDEWLVWGFTAGLIDAVLESTGLAEEWDQTRVVSL